MAIAQDSDLDFQSTARLTNLPAPASENDAARLADVNAAAENQSWKDSVVVATSSNINLASPGATLDGITMAADDRVLVRGQTAASENGIYVFNGSSSAMTRSIDADTADSLEAAIVTVEEGTDAEGNFRQTAVNFTLDTDDVVWSTFGTATPDASTTTKGKVELATDAEMTTGTDTERVVTVAVLANWTKRARGAAADIGDGSATQFDVTHNFGTRDVMVQVRKNASPYDYRAVEMQALDTNTVRIIFNTAPTSNQFRVLVDKVGGVG